MNNNNDPTDFAAVFEQADDGSYWVYVPDLPGCISHGEDLKEAEAMIREAISLHVEFMRERGEEVPAPSTQVRVVHAA